MKTPKVLAVGTALLLLTSAACSAGASPSASTSGAPATSAAAATPSPTPGPPIKIGMIFPLSGALAQGGKVNVQGIQIAVDQVNAAGGVFGRQIQLISTDAPDAATAVANANRLITQDNVSIIVGSVSSDLALAAAPVANRNKVIYWEVQAVSNKLTSQGFQYLFRTVSPASALGAAAANYALGDIAKQLGKDPSSLRVAVLNIQGSYGEDTTQGVLDTLKAAGVTPVDQANYAFGVKDLTSVILKEKQANPDVVIATSYPPDTILYIQQSAQLGFHPGAYIGTGAGQTTAQFLDGVKDAANGVLSAASPIKVNSSQLSADAQAAMTKFDADYQAKYNAAPDQGATLAYVGMMDLLKDVLPQAGSTDPDKIRAAALAADQPLGSSINGWGLKFDANGQNTRASVVIVQWQSGALKIVYPANVAEATLQSVTPNW
jgi:branched-chain amino acid transport system substrate-binding protein